ncbi:MAG: High affinity Ca2+/Mn2+ P-type ATPase-like protein [Caeruleum heppii]|nr:MAG: High affinity Ca2+/Mn2+ P-type ATPase-like protein [Caeruleum heppii]
MSGSADPALPLHTLPREPPTSPSVAAERTLSSSSSITSTYSRLDPHQLATRLSTSIHHGLSQPEASARLLAKGPNELPHEDPEPLWMRFVKQFKETLILLLLASAAVSFFMGNLDDAVSITIAVTIVVSVGFVQEYRSEKSLEALSRLVPHYAHLIRGGTASPPGTPHRSQSTAGSETEMLADSSPAKISAADKASTTVPASQLVPGDLVLFSTGDRIPADVRITSATDLSIDESNLTGENEPVRKTTDSLSPQAARATATHHSNDGRLSPSPTYASPAAGTVGTNLRLNEQTNIAFMGTLVRSGYGQGIVIATGGSTEFGAISASLTEIESPRTPLQLSMDRLGQELSYMSFGVILLIVLVGLWQGRQLLDMFTIGVSLAVAAIPEGLPIIVTVTLALGVLRMARQGAIVRRLPSVETLGSVNVVCSDKTGTLTMNHMTVTKLWHFDDESPMDVSKELLGSTPDPTTRTVLRIGNIANNARLSRAHADSPATAAVFSSTGGQDTNAPGGKSRWVGQPTDVAMLDLLDAFGEDDLRERISARTAETPFSSERKWMGVVIGGSPGSTDSSMSNGTPSGLEKIYVKGALEQVLKRCDTYLTRDGREVVMDEARRKIASEAAEKMALEGLRVIAFASGTRTLSNINNNLTTQIRSRASTPRPDKSPILPTVPNPNDEDIYQNLTFAGLAGMNDPPRAGVDKSIRRLMAGGVKVIMITGDAETTAVAIGRKIGMPIGPIAPPSSHPRSTTAPARPVMNGDELDRMSEADLAQSMSGTTIFARTSPEHKMKIIRALQSLGSVVAMTGDGVNDAPALKKADIGISMGLLGTDVAKEAADMILTDDDFSTILSAIEEGKGIFYNIQNFLTFQLSTSVAALSLVLVCGVWGLKVPLNAMQILWINILMDGPPAQSLGVEPVDPAIMTRPPRPRHARVLTRPLIQRVLLSASTIMLGTLSVYLREMSSTGAVTRRDTTMTFSAFVLFDMFNALTCRSEAKSFLIRGRHGEARMSLFGNRMFNAAVGMSLLGQLAVVYLPALQGVFQTEALGLVDLLGLVGLASYK